MGNLLSRRLSFALIAVAALAKLVSGASAQPSAISVAFAHVFAPNVSATAAARFVEDGNARLASALGDAASGLLGDTTQNHPVLAVHVGSIRAAAPDVARVSFAIVVHESYGTYTEQFTGGAVKQDGTWKVAWPTACFLAEYHNVLCPAAPRGIAASPVPAAALPARFAHPSAPGLIRPTALAVARDGSLLIADQTRDAVFRRSPTGKLTVVADGLDNPSGLAVAANGTVYVSDTGDNRILAVAPHGTVATVAHVRQPEGLALAADGSLYVATSTAIRRVDAQGRITTFAQGQPPYDDITVDGRQLSFSPESLAFDGAGDLYVFSSSPKALVELSTAGAPLRYWTAYANGIASAPDGSVIVAGHGAALQRIANGKLTQLVDFTKTKIPGYNVPPVEPGGSFEPEGIAVSATGTVYVDTYVGDGWTDQTALARVSPTLRTSLLRITTPATATLPALGAPGFPAALYPQPEHGCPSPAGLTAFTPSAKAAAIAEAKQLDTSFQAGLRSSDRAWWPGLYTDWIDGQYGIGRHTVVNVGPATGDLYAAAVARSCGTALLHHSLAIVVGPSAYSTQISHLFFLDRNGKPLLYRQHT